MTSPLMLCLIAGFCFGVWPLVVRSTSLGSYWIAVLVSVGTTVLVAAGAYSKLLTTSTPALRPMALCLLAGAINGIGILVYSRVISNTSWDVTKYVPLTAVLMISFAAVGAFMLFKEPLTLQKMIGLSFAVVAVWLLA